MEGKTMVADQEAGAYAGASLPVGELVTLVIDEERFFGWVASASPAHSLACVAIEFKRGSHRVQELIPVKISSGSEIIYRRIRNYARRRSKARRCGKGACNLTTEVGSWPILVTLEEYTIYHSLWQA